MQLKQCRETTQDKAKLHLCRFGNDRRFINYSFRLLQLQPEPSRGGGGGGEAPP
jgi:hypothetical protein